MHCGEAEKRKQEETRFHFCCGSFATDAAGFDSRFMSASVRNRPKCSAATNRRFVPKPSGATSSNVRARRSLSGFAANKKCRDCEAGVDTEVLIVGAGPVGLTLSIDLGKRGIRCILTEKNEAPLGYPKMERCNPRTMESGPAPNI